MNQRPMRPTEEIARLQERCRQLEQRMAEVLAEVQPVMALIPHLQESIEQLHAILECGDKPAPIFLRWEHRRRDRQARPVGQGPVRRV